MHLSLKTFCLLFFASGVIFPGLQAQPRTQAESPMPVRSVPGDSIVPAATTVTAYAGALQLYHSYLTPETGLFRGPRYMEYVHTLREGHPYFDDGHMHPGMIYYDGVLYEHLSLLYDLVKGQVVIDDPFDNYKIGLINELIDSFTSDRHIFIRLRDSLNPSQPHNGFYEQLYKGRMSLLKKEKKVVEDDLSAPAMGVQHYISHSISYYIKKGNTYYSVNNRPALLSVMKDRSKELKKFMRKNGLNVRKDKENTLLRATAWYDGFNQ